MKFLNTKASLAGMTSFLLVAAALLGFSFVTPRTVAASPIDDTTTPNNGGGAGITPDSTSLDATTTTSTTIELAEEPFAVGRYTTASEDMITEIETRFSFEGNTTITLPNTAETTTTRDTGEGTFSLFPGYSAGSLRGHIHMATEDGSESAIVEFTEFAKFDSSTGIGIAYFSTNSTGILAPLNNMIAVFLDEEQPNEDIVVRFFEWNGDGGGGVPTGIDNGATTTSNVGDDTTIAAPTTAIETPALFIP
ncbi:MAG: hypothetical protein M3297_16855 [Thermoproteota archaeon]|nr:hypothetical protein [Thermoproteota archaeon]